MAKAVENILNPYSHMSVVQVSPPGVYHDIDRRVAALIASGKDEDEAFEMAADHCELVADYFEGDALAWG